MTQEFVTVQAAGGKPRKRRRKPSRTRRRRVIATALAIAALVWATLGVVSMWPNPTPEPGPLPAPTERTPDTARSTALVYQEWLNRSAFVECLHAQGLNYEPRIVSQQDLLGPVAQYLEVEPATANPDAPHPILRQPDLYLEGEGTDLATESGPCTLASERIDTADPTSVNQAVEQARDDEPFLATLAEQVWAQQHPSQITHQVSLLRHDGEVTEGQEDGSDAWREQLAVVTGAIQDRTVWVPITTGNHAEFAQTVGLLSSGGAVAVRVSELDVLLDDGTYMTHTDSIRCGPVTMSLGVLDPWGSEEDFAEVMQAMSTGCAELIAAGFAQAETLAEVYWD